VLRVVIDPNVFVSAAITPDGVPAQIVRAALAREFDLVVSPVLIGELVDVLARPKLRQYIDGEQAQTLVDGILGVAELFDDPHPFRCRGP
jgi:putative PIN family toxin of toxin-antitoxin system